MFSRLVNEKLSETVEIKECKTNAPNVEIWDKPMYGSQDHRATMSETCRN
jgi:hypothetical protein